MKMLKALSLLLAIASLLPVFAQSGRQKDDLRWLRKMLVKEVSQIRKVEIDGCQISIKSARLPGAPDYYSTNTNNNVFGGLPRDDASNVLSSGPGAPYSPRTKAYFAIFNLSDIEVADIEIYGKKEFPTIRLKTKAGNGIRILRKGQEETAGFFDISIKEKIAGEFLARFSDAARSCQK